MIINKIKTLLGFGKMYCLPICILGIYFVFTMKIINIGKNHFK